MWCAVGLVSGLWSSLFAPSTSGKCTLRREQSQQRLSRQHRRQHLSKRLAVHSRQEVMHLGMSWTYRGGLGAVLFQNLVYKGETGEGVEGGRASVFIFDVVWMEWSIWTMIESSLTRGVSFSVLCIRAFLIIFVTCFSARKGKEEKGRKQILLFFPFPWLCVEQLTPTWKDESVLAVWLRLSHCDVQGIIMHLLMMAVAVYLHRQKQTHSARKSW